jgi:hypothetical protein
MSEMHPSLKDKALDNKAMKGEIEFYKMYMEEEKRKIANLETEIKELKSAKTNTKTKVFEDVFKKRDM